MDDRGAWQLCSGMGGDLDRNKPWSGDNRNWGPWNANGNYLHIRREESRFIGEGAACALASLQAIERGVSPEHRWPLDGWVWNLHGGSTDTYFRDFPAKSIALWQCFAALENIEQAVEVSQFAQAWGAMALVLHCRRRWPDTGGSPIMCLYPFLQRHFAQGVTLGAVKG